MARVVVTGGAGFVGSHLCDSLVERGDEVMCLDNLLTGSEANVEHLAGNDRFDLELCDVTERVAVRGPVDAVLHLASPASPVDYLRLPVETLEVGSLGTRNCLRLAREKGARFLLASTSEVYGDPAEHPQTEDYWGHVNPIGPRSVYDEAKRFAEALTMAEHRHRGVDVRIARVFNTYGPRMAPDDGRAVSNFIVRALAGKPLQVYGDGAQTRSFCYVDDLVLGILALLRSDHVGPVNLGNPDEHTVLELAQAVGEVTDADVELAFEPGRVDDPTRRCPDIGLARRLLGWEPAVALADGLTRTADWFRRPQS